VNYPWGKYVSGSGGAGCLHLQLEPASRPTPCRSLAKAGANYMNSQLIRMEAEINGYSEGSRWDVNGYLSGGFGREPLPGARWHSLPPRRWPTPCCAECTRNLRADHCQGAGHFRRRAAAAARDGVHLRRGLLQRDSAEVTHLRSVDKIMVGDARWAR